MLTRRHPEQAEQSAHQRLLENVLHLQKLGLVVLHVFDELADVVVGAVDLVVFGGEGSEEEGGEGGAGDVGGGEAEDVSDLFARIVLGRLSQLKRRVVPVDFLKG